MLEECQLAILAIYICIMLIGRLYICVCATLSTTPPGHPELAIRTIIMAFNGYDVLFTG